MFGRIFSKINSFVGLPVVAAVLLPVFGTLVWYAYTGIYVVGKKEEINLIEEKLNKFYYPLQAQFSASGNEWKAFRQKYGVGRSSYFITDRGININGKIVYLRECYRGERWVVEANQIESWAAVFGQIKDANGNVGKFCLISNAEIDAWMTHMKAQNKGSRWKTEDIIFSGRHLIKDDKEMIGAVESLMLHYTGYRDVIARWEEGDRSVMASHINFPKTLEPLIEDRIKKLESLKASLKASYK